MLREIGIAMRLHVVALAASLLLAPDAASKEPELGVDPMQTTSTVAGEESVREGALQIGVYDPHNKFRASPHPQIEHVFVYWQELDTRMLAEKISLAGETGRTLMVTVEPYTKAANWRDGGDRLFADIAAGKFDGEIESSCKAIASFPGEYWIRWGHEMEDATPRYPWARSDPRGYVMAYRKFVDKCRKIAPRARFVWSPKGERGLEAYYPGDTYVDMVGLSLWGFEKWDLRWYGQPRGFTQTFREKYRRVEQFEKPVIIAEVGVAGRHAYRRAWLLEMLAMPAGSASFPLLTGLVYFNDKEPYHWPNGYGSPDWRLSASALAELRPVRFSSR